MIIGVHLTGSSMSRTANLVGVSSPTVSRGLHKPGETCKQGVVILEHRKFCRKKSLQHRVKMICDNASIMVAGDHLPQEQREASIHGKILRPTPS
ncbi:hypothetical protein TNCV_3249421 [Trichonephila clavipes]|nr:hypothetical protein TNCV_3249421 [Trichonephila clavipes]